MNSSPCATRQILPKYISSLVYAAALCVCLPPRVGAETAPGRLRVYLAKALAKAFFALTFCEPTKESTATAIARSISTDEQ